MLLDETEPNFSVCTYFIHSFLRLSEKNRSHAFTATTHGWVNVDFMLDACLVGFLVPEPSTGSAEDE